MAASRIDTAELAHQLTCCAQDVSEPERPVQLALFRLLAEGRPVEPTRLAAVTGVPAADVVEWLGRWWGGDVLGANFLSQSSSLTRRRESPRGHSRSISTRYRLRVPRAHMPVSSGRPYERKRQSRSPSYRLRASRLVRTCWLGAQTHHELE